MSRFQIKINMILNKHEIETIINDWMTKFNNFDFPGVMDYFHNDIIFENWDESVIKGKKLLSRTWSLWFKNRNFNFETTGLYIDEKEQTATLLWHLKWIVNNNFETRNGLDILHFSGNKIILKKTYSKTSIIQNEKKIILS